MRLSTIFDLLDLEIDPKFDCKSYWNLLIGMASAALSKEERFRASSGEDGSPGTRHKWQKHSCNLKGHRIECSGLSAAALSQIVGQAKSTAVAR